MTNSDLSALRPEDLHVTTLGPATVTSPLADAGGRLTSDDRRVLVSSNPDDFDPSAASFELAGPRRDLFFHGPDTRAAIVTCGGLCPGINDVVRSVFLSLHHLYGVREVCGIRYGYSGLGKSPHAPPQLVNKNDVRDIHRFGGSFLGSCRGAPPVAEMVDTLVDLGIDILFTIGGDGTMRGSSAIATEIRSRQLPISVIGIPKTIDNDLHFVSRSFGFTTAVDEASRVVQGAHEEARGAWNGIGLVKLMGRNSGFIAAHATLATRDANFCLVPEVPFRLDGENGFLAALEKRLLDKHHAVVVVAEGAGQDLVAATGGNPTDRSGNPILQDIGLFLKAAIGNHLAGRGIEHAIKYIDPSYIVRSLPACALDSEFCATLAHAAVHAGMAGKTDMFIGFDGSNIIHVPHRAVPQHITRGIDPDGDRWRRVLEATGQPRRMV